MPRSPDEARGLLCELGEHIRGAVIGARDIDMAAVEGVTAADTIYAIDRVADDTLIDWFEEHWPEVELVSEGLEEPVVIGADATWTVIVDPIDGTRGLMYDKRPAWCLAAAAPRGGSLRDVVAAAMTELPTTKQGAADQLSGVRGGGVAAERHDLRRRHAHTAGDPSVVRGRPGARLRWVRQVLRAGQTRARAARGRAVPTARRASTSSTTSTSPRAVSSTSSSPDAIVSSPICGHWSIRTRWPAIPTTCASRCCSRKPAGSRPTRGAVRSTRRSTRRHPSCGSGTRTGRSRRASGRSWRS